MAEHWPVGERRFLGLPRRAAWIAAAVITAVGAATVGAILWFFGWNWIGVVMVFFGVAFLLGSLQTSQFFGLAWVLATRSNDADKRSR